MSSSMEFDRKIFFVCVISPYLLWQTCLSLLCKSNAEHFTRLHSALTGKSNAEHFTRLHSALRSSILRSLVIVLLKSQLVHQYTIVLKKLHDTLSSLENLFVSLSVLNKLQDLKSNNYIAWHKYAVLLTPEPRKLDLG